MALKNTVEFIFHIENHWIAVKDITLVKGSRRNRQKTFFFKITKICKFVFEKESVLLLTLVKQNKKINGKHQKLQKKLMG